MHELKKSLKAIGSDLAVALDRPENVIPGAAECLYLQTLESHRAVLDRFIDGGRSFPITGRLDSCGWL